MGPTGIVHFAGAHKGTRLRLSTAIETFDLAAMTGTTRSGRTYSLQGVRNDALGILAVALFLGQGAARECGMIAPEELELALASPVNGLRA